MPGNASTKNSSVKFQKRATAGDGYGNVQGDWADLCGPFFARLRPIVGREEILAQRLAGVQPYELTVPLCADTLTVTSECRAVEVNTGETFGIVDIRNPDERGFELAMMVRKGMADG